MKTLKTISVDNLVQHPYYAQVYQNCATDYLVSSIKRTGNQPIYPIIVVPIPDEEDRFWIVAGYKRLQILLEFGNYEVEVMVYDIAGEKEIKNLIIDLNKQRLKTGHELVMEFRHCLEVYPAKRGVKGNRYEKIGNELHLNKEQVKDLVILDKFFAGQGESILDSVFDFEGININQANTLMKIIDQFPEKFSSDKTYVKLCNRKYDFTRLKYVVETLNIEDEDDFRIGETYLLREKNITEFKKILMQLGKIESRQKAHEDSKTEVQSVNDEFTTEHTHIVNADNRFVDLGNKFGKKIKGLIGSPPYGDKRLNGNELGIDTGHNMTGEEYGKYLAETYARYIPEMEDDGSVYAIIDDFRLKNGELACSLEHFVVEMQKVGFYLVSRYVWIKNNPMPMNYKVKQMVNGIEFIYRFVLDPVNYYTNENLYNENALPDGAKYMISHGCTNQSKDGKTTRGGDYVQSELKKLRNTLSEQECINAIQGNVANPETFFVQVGDKKHTSTAPIYLTSVLILECTQEGDLVADCWNGVGNTMDSALLLNRLYWGVEKEENYFDQTCRRAEITEEIVKEFYPLAPAA